MLTYIPQEAKLDRAVLTQLAQLCHITSEQLQVEIDQGVAQVWDYSAKALFITRVIANNLFVAAVVGENVVSEWEQIVDEFRCMARVHGFESIGFSTERKGFTKIYSRMGIKPVAWVYKLGV